MVFTVSCNKCKHCTNFHDPNPGDDLRCFNCREKLNASVWENPIVDSPQVIATPETQTISVLDIADRLIRCAEIRKEAALGSCGVNDSALPEVERFLLSLLKPCVILKDKPPA